MHTPINVSVLNNLMELLQRDVVQSLQLPALPVVLYVKTLHNPYSDVHIFQIDPKHLNLHVYVKIPHASPSNLHLMQKRLAAEFKIMQQLHSEASATTNTPYCHVARPLGYYPEHLAIVTFKAGAQTLRQHYRSAARLLYNSKSRELLLKEVINCGLWLKKFQQCTAAGTAAFDGKQLIDYVKIRLDSLIKKSNIEFSIPLSDKIISQIATLSESIDPQMHKISGRHNDFSSHNILTDRGKVWAIDFSMYDTGSSVYDPSYFWLELEMLKIDPSYSTKFLDFLQDAFLEAYGSISINSPVFNLVRCQYSINRILTLHNDTRLPTPGTFYRRSAVKACMEWVIKFAHYKSV